MQYPAGAASKIAAKATVGSSPCWVIPRGGGARNLLDWESRRRERQIAKQQDGHVEGECVMINDRRTLM